MSDFANAIAKPEFAFKGLCSDLVLGEAARRKDGKLWCMPGGYAYVFKYKTFLPDKFWAIKCFSKLPPNLAIHYQTVSTYLSQSAVAHYFVFFKFIEKGIRTTDGKQHPILKMEWVNGANLKTYIRKNISDSTKLKKLAELFFKMCQDLATYGVGHGDFHHENIFVVEDGGKLQLKLIDYDSFYVSDWKKDIDEITQGYDGYQHPLRAIQVTKRCLEVDYFSQLVIYLTIIAFAEDKSLWHKLTIDDRDGLLFTVKDFLNPEKSSIFSTLSGYSGEILRITNILKSLCLFKDIYQLSHLEAVLATSQPKNNSWISNNLKSNSHGKPTKPQAESLIQPLIPKDTLNNISNIAPPSSKEKWIPISNKLNSQSKSEAPPTVILPPIPTPSAKEQWMPFSLKSVGDKHQSIKRNINPRNFYKNKKGNKYLYIWLFLGAFSFIGIIYWNFLSSVNTKKSRSPAEECRVQHPAQRNLCFE